MILPLFFLILYVNELCAPPFCTLLAVADAASSSDGVFLFLFRAHQQIPSKASDRKGSFFACTPFFNSLKPFFFPFFFFLDDSSSFYFPRFRYVLPPTYLLFFTVCIVSVIINNKNKQGSSVREVFFYSVVARTERKGLHSFSWCCFWCCWSIDFFFASLLQLLVAEENIPLPGVHLLPGTIRKREWGIEERVREQRRRLEAEEKERNSSAIGEIDDGSRFVVGRTRIKS